MSPFPIHEAEEATVGPDGTAQVTFPIRPGQAWTVTRVSVDCTVADPMPEATVYRNSPTRHNIITHTNFGAAATADGTAEIFTPGQLLIVQWIGAAPGASCVATLGGTYTLG